MSAAPTNPPPARPAAGPTPGPQPRPGRVPWWIVPLVIIGVVVIAWLIMAGLPFGGEKRARVAERPKSETIAEGTPPVAPPQSSGTILEVPAEPEPEPLPTTTTVPPVIVQQPPVIVQQPPPATQTVAPSRPAPQPPPATREISEDQAVAVLRGYVTSRRYYDGVAPECVQIRGSGYRNTGYGFSVWDSCADGGGSRMLGRWRVDSKTQEVFVQGDDGRYLRP